MEVLASVIVPESWRERLQDVQVARECECDSRPYWTEWVLLSPCSVDLHIPVLCDDISVTCDRCLSDGGVVVVSAPHREPLT